jgi:hypothetical protein
LLSFIFCNLYQHYQDVQIKADEMGGTYSTYIRRQHWRWETQGRWRCTWEVKTGVRVWTRFVWLRTGISGGLCEHGNEISDSIKTQNFLTSWATITFWMRTAPLRGAENDFRSTSYVYLMYWRFVWWDTTLYTAMDQFEIFWYYVKFVLVMHMAYCFYLNPVLAPETILNSFTVFLCRSLFIGSRGESVRLRTIGRKWQGWSEGWEGQQIRKHILPMPWTLFPSGSTLSLAVSFPVTITFFVCIVCVFILTTS